MAVWSLLGGRANFLLDVFFCLNSVRSHLKLKQNVTLFWAMKNMELMKKYLTSKKSYTSKTFKPWDLIFSWCPDRRQTLFTLNVIRNPATVSQNLLKTTPPWKTLVFLFYACNYFIRLSQKAEFSKAPCSLFCWCCYLYQKSCPHGSPKKNFIFFAIVVVALSSKNIL